MSEAIIKKNGTDYPLLTMPNHYPADRVYLDGDTTKTVQDAVDKSQAMIATVQPNLTAVKAYAKGEQFVYNGLLYKVTAAISIGGTITINGNCTLADSVTEQIRNANDVLNGLTETSMTASSSSSTTIGSTYQAVTATYDGYLRFEISSGDTSIVVATDSYGTNLIKVIYGRSSSEWAYDMLPMRKGQTVYVKANGNNGKYKMIYFH